MIPSATDDLAPTRASLLQRLKDSEDQGSWQQFLDTYGRLLRGVALKAGLTETEAQDAVQDTVIAVARNIRDFRYDRKQCSFKSWLMLITRQRIIWQLRKRLQPGAPRAASSQPEESVTGTATIDRIPDPDSLNLDAVWDAEWERNLMSVALERVKARVNPRQFRIYDLCVLQEWPVREVTRVLGVNTAQVYLARHRIGRALKAELQRLAKSEPPARGDHCI